MADTKQFNFIIKILRDMGRFTFIPNAGGIDEAFLMESIYTLLDKEKLPYIVKSFPDETDKKVVMCSENMEHIKSVLKNKNTEQLIFLPNHYSTEEFTAFLDERCTLFCHDTVSFDFMKKHAPKSNIYLADNFGFEVNLNNIQHLSKTAEEIPLGKRYLIWNLASSFMTSIKNIRLGNTNYKVGYFLKESGLLEAVDISSYYYGKNVQRSLTKWLTTLFVGIIKAPDIIITNLFPVALIAERLGKTVFIWQDKNGQEILKTKLENSTLLFPIAPKKDVQKNIYSILQNMSVSHTSTLKLFYSLNPIPEADINLNNFKNFYSKNIKKYSFKGFLTVLNWLKNMMLFYKKSNISNSKSDPWENFYKLYSKQKGSIVDKFYFLGIPVFKRRRKR